MARISHTFLWIAVCVSVQGEGLEDIQVYVKAGDECITATQPNVSIERVE
jgi:hypothetical protein